MTRISFAPGTAATLAIALLALAAAPAAARPASPQPCAVTDTTAAADGCVGYVGGNTSVGGATAMIQQAGWPGMAGTLLEYKDGTVGAGSTGSTTFLFDAVRLAGDASTGSITFSQALSGPFVLGLKGGADWAAYYFDGTRAFAGGEVIAFDIPGTTGAGFSHAAIYTNAMLTAVPEAGSWAMMLAGLGAIGFLARRRRAG